MSKRHRTDSTAGVVEITRGALSGAPQPPSGVKISKEVQPFWEMVTTAKAKRAWTDSDLILAADVARCMYRLELVSKELENTHPAAEVKDLERRADLLAKRVRMMNTHLQIHPGATQGAAHKQIEQNKAHREALEWDTDTELDGLLARPAK